MREIKVRPKATTDEPEFPLVSVKVDDEVVSARRPKESVMARAAGIFADKYAPNALLAKTAFDFLETTLEPESWAYVRERMNDRDDPFDTEDLTNIFEALFDEFTEQAREAEEPANREARRAKPRKAAAR